MPKAKRSKKSAGRTIGEVFSVEEILDKDIRDGKVYYYLKWFGYDEKDNTWEPEENLSCPQLIEDFERRYSRKQETAKKPSTEKKPSLAATVHTSSAKPPPAKKKPLSKGSGSSSESESSGIKLKVVNGGEEEEEEGEPKGMKNMMLPKSGFIRGLEAETILGATEEAGKIMFLIKW